MADRNVDKSKLEVRLCFADEASWSKVCTSQLVSYHASHYINSAAANNDTIEHQLHWLVPRLQVEYRQHVLSLSPNTAWPSALLFHCTLSNLSNWLTAHSCKSAEG